MLIIVGLGNPGSKYAATRHNIGFEVVDYFAQKHRIGFDKTKHKALIGQGTVSGEKVVLIKPQTYMNLSGESVRGMMDFYKETAASVIVIYDDISLNVGALRIRDQGSAGGHNGMKSIIAHLGTDVFTRLKVGVGPQPRGWDSADFVMTTFPAAERTIMKESIEHTSEALECIITDGLMSAMNRFNKK